MSYRRRSDWLSSVFYGLISLLRHRKAPQLCLLSGKGRRAEGDLRSAVPWDCVTRCVLQVRSDERGFPSARQIQRWNVEACRVGNTKVTRYLQKVQLLAHAAWKKNVILPVVKK